MAMADFEEQLNAILSSPESMQQVAQLAQMLSSQNAPAARDAAGAAPQQPPSPAPPPQPDTAPPGGSDLSSLSSLSSLLGSFDAKSLSRFLPLLQELNSSRSDERTQLLYALKPFLRPERRDKIDTALHLARLFHAGKTFLKGWGDSHV